MPRPQSGIGTYTSSHAPGFLNAITRRSAKMLDQAIAWSLPLHTQGTWENLSSARNICTNVIPSRIQIPNAELYVETPLPRDPTQETFEQMNMGIRYVSLVFRVAHIPLVLLPGCSSRYFLFESRRVPPRGSSLLIGRTPPGRQQGANTIRLQDVRT